MSQATLGPLVAGRTVCGDTLHVLAEVPPSSVDTTFADWPYSQSSPVRGKDVGAAGRVYGPASFLVNVLQRLHRVSRDGAHLYLFCDWRGIPDAGYAMSVSGWFPTTIIAWTKGHVGTGGVWRSGWDPIFFASKGPADKRTDNAFKNVINCPAVRQDREHPYQKPSYLWERLCAASVRQGTVVLDAFAGSGSSRAPVKTAGGTWFGIDVDSTYANAGASS